MSTATLTVTGRDATASSSPSSFSSLLSRVDKLQAIQQQQRIQELEASEGAAAKPQNRYLSPLSPASLSTDLRSVFAQSEQLWKNRGGSPAQLAPKKTDGRRERSLLFGDKGVTLTGRKKTAADGLDDTDGLVPTSEEDETANRKLLKRLRLEAQRAFLNHTLVEPSAISASSVRSPMAKSVLDPFDTTRASSATTTTTPASVVHPSQRSRLELLFADRISHFVRAGCRAALAPMFRYAIEQEEEQIDANVHSVWMDALAVLGAPNTSEPDDVGGQLQSVSYARLIMKRGLTHLTSTHAQHMRDNVERSLATAERGGRPGTLSLVQAFLKATGFATDQPEERWDRVEDGVTADGLRCWQLAFLSFRSGDADATCEALSQLVNFSAAANLVRALNELKDGDTIHEDTLKKLRLEWRHEQQSIHDKYKKAFYYALLGGDYPCMWENIEDWMFFKLTTLRVNPHLSWPHFAALQKQISVDFGEEHFMGAAHHHASPAGRDFHIYATALLLSGQFERCFAVLVESGRQPHAVHLALLAHHNGFLRVQTDPSKPLLTLDENDFTVARLNLARLLVNYTKSFELVDSCRALDYFFFLRDTTTDQGDNLFEVALSRQVYLTGDVEPLLGRLNPNNGQREPAAIDQYEGVDAAKLIGAVAEDTYTSGDLTTAIQLFLLAGNRARAVAIGAERLADALALAPRPDFTALEPAAELVRFVRRVMPATKAAPDLSSSLATLCTLLDLGTLLRLSAAGNQQAAVLSVSTRLGILPLTTDTVTACVQRAATGLQQELRLVLPAVCIAHMSAVTELYRQEQRDEGRQRLREHGRALMQFVASLPFKMATHVCAKLLSLNAQLDG